MGNYLEKNAILWVLDLLLQDGGAKGAVCVAWCCCIAVAAAFARQSIVRWKFSVITSRKLFHALAVLIFVPPLAWASSGGSGGYSEFVALAFGVALCGFVLIELARLYLSAAQVSTALDGAFSFLSLFLKYPASKSGELMLDHVTLLIACALPVWISLGTAGQQAVGMPLLPFLGCLSVGIGDAAGAVIGINFGRHKWSRSSARSLEGSAAVFLSMLLCSALLQRMILNHSELGRDRGDVVPALVTAVVVTAVEGVTSYNDNLVLTLFAVATYQSSHLVLR